MNDLILHSNTELMAKIESIIPALLKKPQVDCPVIHHFGPGVYIREVTLPKGTFAIGHQQKTTHMNVFLKGKLTILNDDETLSEIAAPLMYVAPPGRKVVLVHEDVSWLNVYPSDETDVQKNEKKFLDKSPAWVEDCMKRFDIAKHNGDREDFKKVIKEIGLSEKTVWDELTDETNLIDMPYGNYKFKVDSSPIHGIGVFATAGIKTGETIAPALIDNKVTPVWRYINHSHAPNSKMVRAYDDINLIATSNIIGCLGGRNGEEITTNYAETFLLKRG